MKKLVCILLTLCMLMSAVSVLAVTPLETSTVTKSIRINGYETSENKTKGYYYYNPAKNEVLFVAEDESPEGKGNIIKPEKVNADYAFTATTNGVVYHYQLLDEITADGKKQYFIYCNDLYGKNPAVSTSYHFDPDADNNIAKWLNTSFLNGEQGSGMIALDANIKNYITEHDWIVEANSKSKSPYPTTDYSVKCKIALLSITEYAKYADRIGWGAYVGGSLISNAYHVFLRSPLQGGADQLRTLYEATGNTASTSVSNAEARIRPAFYVSEDYFKNIKLDLTAVGNEVKKIISELSPSIYNDGELLSLKEIYTFTEDGSKALSSDEWTYPNNATVADGHITVGTNKWIGRLIEMNGGTVSIETDVVSADSKGLYIGFCEGTGSPSFKYPLYLQSGIVRYITSPSGQTGAQYKRLDDSKYKDLYYTKFASDVDVSGTYKVKLNVNLDNGYCYAAISGRGSDGNEYVKYSPAVKLDSYINKDKTFSKVAFWNSYSSSSGTVLDNIKITYDKNGSMIDSVNVTDKKTIEINVKNYVDLTNVTKDSVLVENNTVTSITKENGKIVATLKNNLEDGERTVIVNDMKRNDVGSANYTIIGNSKVFTVEIPTETVIGAPVISGNLTSGSTVTATSAVTKGTSSDAKPVQFVIAAYNGDRLIGAKIVSVADVNTVTDLKAEITLSENASEVRAFIWDADNYPIRSAVSKNQ